MVDAPPRKCEKNRVKKLIPREWTDSKSGKTYWRVRWNDVNGKETVKVFGSLEEADDHIKMLAPLRKKFARAAAANQDEITGLALWREFVAGEMTAGRDAPSLRDVLKPAVERLRIGQSSPPLEELMDRFYAAKKGKSSLYLAAIKNRLTRFASYLDKAEPAGSVAVEDVERALASMQAGGLSPQSVKGIRSAAFGLFAWAMKRKLVKTNPVDATEAISVDQGEVGIFSPSQLGAILRTALRIQPRAVPALAVWAFCGARRAEINRLHFDNFDRERKELRISARTAKTGKARYVPMPPALIAWLEAAEQAGAAPLGKLVPGKSDAASEGVLFRWLNDIRGEAGLDGWPHNALRHSFASYACADTDDYARVAAWLGHAGGTALLEARYRHACPKDSGSAWFNVFPTDPPPAEETAEKAATRKTRAKKSA